ncbi:hypothetical protein SPRG_00637 [Saprolegnia parasitica CBS 223.65]|uniref:Peptidase C1A papain C-terminal domain-containing protein n=1 Tax=Saprolegnia parasitica (strain CBS 223.65) TaxID=695850 RepID=A0A067CV42_SAPPC|nr:hypothetical protein SPRG_00637 [Saprolegnia parasitica CBS 223.65]KDO34574.1 hypothetical protein SPRG_00637 [Saprolegnia parasitica CBS 223.65]|eukprot:XP_012194251.1 hypothetical protein SPRG_00637 [Saprolegnia parasitica CBS 223.65]
MLSLLTCVLLAPSVLGSYDPIALEAELADWKASRAGSIARAHGFLKSDADDELRRFYATKLDIARLNVVHPNAHFSLDSPFTLLTVPEFAAYVRSSTLAQRSDARPSDANSTTVLPASVDWTTSSCIGSVQQQGNCGSCWAFATALALESAMCLASPTPTLVKLSEQHLTSCDKASGNLGCQGGYPSKAIEYVTNNGLCLGKDYPYVSGTSGNDETCRATSCVPMRPTSLKSVNVVPGEAGLQAAVARQPVIVGIAAGNEEWKQYKSGILASCSTTDLDHAVVVVGWGDSANGSYWRIQNSWGVGWGDRGFMQLQRAAMLNGTCGLASDASYPSLA